jgi:hypothetical protein
MIRRLSRTTVVLALVVAFPGLACAQITITLKNSFIEQYKDKVTISASFTVDKAHKKPNAPSKDGDMHVAGRADEIGLPTVAEIMNAASGRNGQAGCADRHLADLVRARGEFGSDPGQPAGRHRHHEPPARLRDPSAAHGRRSVRHLGTEANCRVHDEGRSNSVHELREPAR